jgi:hypothetical protein
VPRRLAPELSRGSKLRTDIKMGWRTAPLSPQRRLRGLLSLQVACSSPFLLPAADPPGDLDVTPCASPGARRGPASPERPVEIEAAIVEHPG